MNTDLNDMMVFLTVVEAGSFTLAADRLGIPKSNISRKVTRLENELKVTLLERSTRSQHLTEAGTLFLGHCKRIQEELSLAQSSVSELLHSYKGDLRVGASVTMGQQILKPALPQFLGKYPDIRLQLNLLNRRVDMIEEGFDVVIRVGKLLDSSLIGKKLGTVKRKLYAAPGYLASIPKLNEPQQLSNCDLLLMNNGNNDHKVKLCASDAESLIINHQPRLFVDDFSVVKQAAIEGLGIAVLPEYMCRQELQENKLLNLLEDWHMPDIDVFALYPRNRAKIPKVSAFLSFAAELYKQRLAEC